MSSEPSGDELGLDEQSKLVYGIIFSLRHMTRKFTPTGEDVFQSFSTSKYTLHYFCSPTLTHFVLITSPTSDSLKYLLKRLWSGPFMTYVVQNSLVGLDSAQSKRGIDNGEFRAATKKLLQGLSYFD